jgi:hypothetical protein
MVRGHTKSAVSETSASELSIRRSSRPGIICNSFVKTRCSLLSLKNCCELGDREGEENHKLDCKRFLGLFGELAHAQNAIGNEDMYIGHGVQCTAEMATMMDEGIRDAAANNNT